MAPSWTEDAVFQFHSRSKDAPPGEGAGELLRLPPSTFAALAAIPHWRRALSNFAPSPFDLDGLSWLSVEHFFQAAKFRVVDEARWRSFSLTSGTALGRALGPEVKRAGGRRARPLDEETRAWWEAVKRGAMTRALAAKYAQSAEHRAVLVATLDAKLTHRPLRARVARVEVELMEVRAWVLGGGSGAGPERPLARS